MFDYDYHWLSLISGKIEFSPLILTLIFLGFNSPLLDELGLMPLGPKVATSWGSCFTLAYIGKT